MINKLLNYYCKALSVLMVLCLAIMVVMVFGNVVLRYVFNSGIAISEELSRWLFLWVIFLGATVAVHERAHMSTDMLARRLSPAAQKVIQLLTYGLMLFVTWLMFSGSVTQTLINWDVEAPVTGLSSAWAYGCGVVFAFSTGLMLIRDIWRVLTQRDQVGSPTQ